MTKTTISSTGQIAIPKAIRERLNLTEGTEVVINVQGESLVMKRLVDDFPDWRKMRGMFRDTNLLQDLAEAHSAELIRDDVRLNQDN
jgi:AbrB family looped-hinge helix DNA binding protein